MEESGQNIEHIKYMIENLKSKYQKKFNYY